MLKDIEMYNVPILSENIGLVYEDGAYVMNAINVVASNFPQYFRTINYFILKKHLHKTL